MVVPFIVMGEASDETDMLDPEPSLCSLLSRELSSSCSSEV